MSWDVDRWRRECFGVEPDPPLIERGSEAERAFLSGHPARRLDSGPERIITRATTSRPVGLTAEELARNLSLLARVGISVRDLKARWRR